MEERGHILKVLRQVILSLKKKDYLDLKNLSNEVVHTSSIDQDPDVISIAVIIYSLSKLIERESYRDYKSWPKFYSSYITGIENLIKSLEKNNIEEFRINIESIRKTIERLTGDLKGYISEVFRKARINKASRIYEHGISMENTAKILGISVWELAEYAGQTGIGDVNLSITMPIKQRVKTAEDFFG
jgi:hypothetical protein